MQDLLDKIYSAGFARRDAQEFMMERVAEAIQTGRISTLEGGTGIGKSFGYLVPAISHILAGPKPKKIVLSTGTVSLQEQLVNTDLPALQEILDVPFTFALAKGRRRYACNTRLEEMAVAEQDAAGQDDIFDERNDDASAASFVEMHRALAAKEWNGDLDAWPTPLDGRARSEITTDRHGCSGRNCPAYKECAYQLARQDMRSANIIVANHDLLLADLDAQSAGAQLISPMEETVYIIDEAHHFPVKAIEQFSFSAQILGSVDWLKEVPRAAGELPSPLNTGTQPLITEARELRTALENTHQLILANIEDQKDHPDYWRFEHPPAELHQLGKDIQSLAVNISGRLEVLMDQMKEHYKESGEPPPQKTMAALGFLKGRADNLGDTWASVTCEQDPEAPIARWIAPVLRRDGKKAPPDFTVQAAPITAAKALYQKFWSQADNAVVLCSATLRALGSFDRYLNDSGLSRLSQGAVETHVLPSPFDYSQSKLVVPAMQHEPLGGDTQKHLEEIIGRLPEELEAEPGGVLMLFTSRVKMRTIHERLPETIREQILMQGSLPNHKLLEAHAERIEAGERSVIFGMASFSEGVSLPGDLCRHVIIAQLPFAVPDTPVERTRADWIKARGGSPFMEHALPETSVKLTQQVGRLVRLVTDSGRVTILDPRIHTKRYGPLLLKNLPPFPREMPETGAAAEPAQSSMGSQLSSSARTSQARARSMNKIRQTLDAPDPVADGPAW